MSDVPGGHHTNQQGAIPSPTPTLAQVEVDCPKCGHHFLHRLGHVLKEVGIVAAEVAVEAVLPKNFGGGGE